MAIAVKPQLTDFDELKRKLKRLGEEGRQAMKDTNSDMRRRAPSWIAAIVTERYGIKKKDVRDAAHINASGTKLQHSVIGYSVKYDGPLLTPTHFNMKPTARPAGNTKYTVSAEILKSHRKVLARNAFLARGRNSKGEQNEKQIPFQRAGDGRYPILGIKALAVAQMIDNEETRGKINNKIGEEFQKRLEHNIDRYW
jgi:hypothetical protein